MPTTTWVTELAATSIVVFVDLRSMYIGALLDIVPFVCTLEFDVVIGLIVVVDDPIVDV